MLDIYDFVMTNLLPSIPSDLYFLVPIFCVIILVFICLACVSPFLFLFSFLKR